MKNGGIFQSIIGDEYLYKLLLAEFPYIQLLVSKLTVVELTGFH